MEPMPGQSRFRITQPRFRGWGLLPRELLTSAEAAWSVTYNFLARQPRPARAQMIMNPLTCRLALRSQESRFQFPPWYISAAGISPAHPESIPQLLHREEAECI